ncbi:hypothetical protein D3C86_1108720 [compost metagenome]
MLDGRSRNRFKKLIINWAPVDGQIITRPTVGRTFTYVELNFILQEIEKTYQELKNTPAIERIADRVFSIIHSIRAQNDFSDDQEEDEESSEEV